MLMKNLLVHCLIQYCYYISCNQIFYFTILPRPCFKEKQGRWTTTVVCVMVWCSANRGDRFHLLHFPVLVNLGSWLTEQKLIRSHVVFVYPPARIMDSEVILCNLVCLKCHSTKREQFLKKVFGYSRVSRSRLILLCFHCSSFLLFFFVLAVHPLPLFTVCPLPFSIYPSITAVHLFFSQVYHSLLSAAAGFSRLPAPHISLTDYTVAMLCFQKRLRVTVMAQETRSAGYHYTSFTSISYTSAQT